MRTYIGTDITLDTVFRIPYRNVIDVPANWKDAQDESFAKVATGNRQDVVDFVNDIQIPVNGQEGNKIPVSVVKKYENGQTPSGSAAFEKRGIAVYVLIRPPSPISLPILIPSMV